MSAPDLTQFVMVCGGCQHWQVDVTPRAAKNPDALMEAAELHRQHAYGINGEDLCVNPDGRIKVHGQWVDKPNMSSGEQANSVLVGHPLPLWWVWK